MNIEITELPEGAYGLPGRHLEVAVRGDDPAIDWPALRQEIAERYPAIATPNLPTRYYPGGPASRNGTPLYRFEDFWIIPAGAA